MVDTRLVMEQVEELQLITRKIPEEGMTIAEGFVAKWWLRSFHPRVKTSRHTSSTSEREWLLTTWLWNSELSMVFEGKIRDEKTPIYAKANMMEKAAPLISEHAWELMTRPNVRKAKHLTVCATIVISPITCQNIWWCVLVEKDFDKRIVKTWLPWCKRLTKWRTRKNGYARTIYLPTRKEVKGRK